MRTVSAVVLVVLVGAGCTYSSSNRAEELASATPTSLPTDVPLATPSSPGEPGEVPAGVDDDATVGPAPVPGWVVVEGVDAFLNVRSGPGTSFDVIGAADLGVTLPATGNRETVGTSDWVEVTIDEGTGWVSANFVATATEPTPTPISTPTPLPTPTPAAAEGDLVVSAPLGLNFRTDPSVDATIIRELDEGTVVTPTGATAEDDEGRAWVEITHNGDTGWVSENFLRSP